MVLLTSLTSGIKRRRGFIEGEIGLTRRSQGVTAAIVFGTVWRKGFGLPSEEIPETNNIATFDHTTPMQRLDLGSLQTC